ncbi:MAG TPA: DUF309 domain-containing protein [Planctomicrobium sp.]|nr:DUF309 domain-containing protein [Planctomicrobium sp.]
MPRKTVRDDNIEFLHGEKSQNLPFYTYVPGVTPHPQSVHQETVPFAQALERGRILFNHGFYWEAHEAWEQGWITAGRTGEIADLIKAFIKLAACGVKCLEQNESGAIRHATRAVQLFSGSMNSATLPEMLSRENLSIPLERLISYGENLSKHPPIATAQQRESARTGGVLLLGELPDETRNPAES